MEITEERTPIQNQLTNQIRSTARPEPRPIFERQQEIQQNSLVQ